MATLKDAVLARAIGLDAIAKQIQAVRQPLQGDTVMVQSFPWHTTVILGFWVAGAPHETFTWNVEVTGRSDTPVQIGGSGTIASNGETSISVPVPLEMSGPGILSIVLNVDGTPVWTRPVIVHAAGSQSPRIQ